MVIFFLLKVTLSNKFSFFQKKKNLMITIMVIIKIIINTATLQFTQKPLNNPKE